MENRWTSRSLDKRGLTVVGATDWSSNVFSILQFVICVQFVHSKTILVACFKSSIKSLGQSQPKSTVYYLYIYSLWAMGN